MRRAVVMLLAVSTMIGGSWSGTSNAARARSSGQVPLLVGDSVMAGMTGASRADLSARHPHVFDAEVCRRLISQSCSYQGDTPSNALDAIRRRAGQFSGVIVVAAGYNDGDIAAAVDAVVAEARSQGVDHVVWLTYRLAGSHAASYQRHNDTLVAKTAEYPELSIADWATLSAGRSDWVSGDGLHLNGAGARAMAGLVADALDGLTPSRCASASGGEAPPPVSAATRHSRPGGVVTRPQPARAVDTRARAGGAVVGGRVLRVDVQATGVPADAVGVIATVTAIDPCDDGFLTGFACGDHMPRTSTLNYTRSRTVANMVMVSVADGDVCVYSSATVDVAIDVVGHVTPDGAPMTAIDPARILDTRAHGPVTPGEPVAIDAATQALPPATEAVMVNVTATSPSAPGFVTVYPSPCSAAPPPTSNLNYDGGDAAASTIVRLGADGRVCVIASSRTHLVVDLVGAIGGDGSRVVLAEGARLADTRTGEGRGTSTVRIDTALAAPRGATGAIVNIAAAGDPPGFSTVHACDSDDALATSTVSHGGSPAANLVAVTLDDGAVCIDRSTAADAVVDAVAWLTPAPLAPRSDTRASMLERIGRRLLRVTRW